MVACVGADVVPPIGEVMHNDGASVGAGGACAWTSAKPDNRKKREKLAVPNILSFIIIAPPACSFTLN